MGKFINYLVFIVFLVFSFPTNSFAEQVCFSAEQSTDIIQILDASDRNIELLESCNSLVDHLYSEIEVRDDIIKQLTEENIQLKQEVRRLNKQRSREKYLRYAGIGAIVYAIVRVAAAAAAL